MPSVAISESMLEQHDERAVDEPDGDADGERGQRSPRQIDQPWFTFRIASIIAASVIVAATERS